MIDWSQVFAAHAWQQALLRLPRLLRVAKHDSYFAIWEQHVTTPLSANLLRLSKLFFSFLFVLHGW